ncbi:MAG: 4-(cytidine 5'-diphospho)-2-C-methyl-D-erythritol kinase [Candidatus Omnitrophota bacterium]|nr:4-(cytidine 5'-diphospho)-2-C-methyl-D-erythritol kinase [Candidatus Omnitrophota bacterium]
MREIRVFAPAKLNLYLDVLNKRSDGYHNIETIFEKIDLKDEIIIKEKGRGLKIKASSNKCSQDKNNIVYKAIKALSVEAKIRPNLEIYIKKNIPVSAGLGGGSSNAASSLKAINELFDLGVSEKRLFEIALGLGKDVPFFMKDTPFAVAGGAGEVLKKLGLTQSFFHILIKPFIPLSTRLMYNRIDRHNFSSRPHSLKKALSALRGRDIEALEDNYYNIFEDVLGRDSVHIDKVKTMLSRAGSGHSLLSGSGPTVFCTFGNKKSAERVFKAIPKHRAEGVFLVKTYKGGIYGDNRG